jgi:hypothetical protein
MLLFMQGSREIILGSQIYIESTDFRAVDSSDYFGLAPGKLVCVKNFNSPVIYPM